MAPRIHLGRRRTPTRTPEPPDEEQGPRHVLTSRDATPTISRRAARERFVVGCMTGTSVDGIDAALVAIDGHGLAARPRFVRGASLPLGALGATLRALLAQEPMTAGAIAAASRELAELHVAIVRELRPERLDLVCAHGQTIFHAPPLSWQLLAPVPIAHALQVPVVCDLRAADLAAGGEGAPITPLADRLLFAGAEERAVVNLGGFCNITRLGAAGAAMALTGGDVCACNQLLDALSRALLDAPYDVDGVHALAGSVDTRALESLQRALAAQATARRSLGTGDELGAWLARWQGRVPPADLARTACAAIAKTIIRAAQGARLLILAGGGVRNRALITELTARAGISVRTSDQFGVPIDMREAIAMAVLGALCADGEPITVPEITHVAQAPIAGVWAYPTARHAAPPERPAVPRRR